MIKSQMSELNLKKNRAVYPSTCDIELADTQEAGCGPSTFVSRSNYPSIPPRVDKNNPPDFITTHFEKKYDAYYKGIGNEFIKYFHNNWAHSGKEEASVFDSVTDDSENMVEVPDKYIVSIYKKVMKNRIERTIVMSLSSLIILLTLIICNLVSFSGLFFLNIEEIDKLKYSHELGIVMRNIYTERSLMAIRNYSVVTNSKTELLQQFIITDKSIDNLSSQISKKAEYDFNEELFKLKIAKIRIHLQSLSEDDLENELINLYKKVLAWVKTTFEICILSMKKQVHWPALISYETFNDLIDTMSTQVIYGTRYYAKGKILNRDMSIFAYTIPETQKFIEMIKINSEFATNHLNNFDHFRRSLFNNCNRMLLRITSMGIRQEEFEKNPLIETYFYYNMTLNINEYGLLQGDMFEHILNKFSVNLRKQYTLAIANIAILLLTIPFAYKLLSNIFSQRIERKLSSKKLTRKLNRINESNKTMTHILNTIFPPAVSSILKFSNKKPIMEYFDSASIFFSDIVGFTTLCLDKNPEEVFSMLNRLFHYFDDLIAKRDVFKVQTIGDAYLVVSGVPLRNGDMHVSELCMLAIEFQRELMKMANAGTVYKLRIGISTGSVMAGILERRKPRYTLLGTTVQRSIQLQESGEVGKIHIDYKCFDHINRLGNFIVEPNVDTMHMDEEHKSYWLIGEKNK